MRSRILGTLVGIAMAMPLLAGEGSKAKSPQLNLRANPRFAIRAPVNVLATAELMGGDEVEEFYCPALEWEWGDGSRSVQESDCAPFQPGDTLERHFSAEHVFRGSGTYNVRVTMRRTSRQLAVAAATISVQ
jgi:hypothetical protein